MLPRSQDWPFSYITISRVVVSFGTINRVAPVTASQSSGQFQWDIAKEKQAVHCVKNDPYLCKNHQAKGIPASLQASVGLHERFTTTKSAEIKSPGEGQVCRFHRITVWKGSCGSCCLEQST